MTTTYLDTSAAAKLLVEEAESQALADYLDSLDEGEAPCSSLLLETELRRVAVRLDLEQSEVSELLAKVDLVEPNRSLFHQAGLLPGRWLRSLDALHLGTALRLEAPVFVSYDKRLLDAAHSLGMTVASPRDDG